MKKFYQSALLAALGLGSITAAQAQSFGTDLGLGFNDAAGGSPAQNDYVIDLGAFSTLQTDAQNAPGGTIDLMGSNAGLNPINASTFTANFNSYYSSDASYLTDVAAGVVGANTGGSPKLLWQTAPTGTTPSTVNGTAFNIAAGDAGGVVAGEYSSAAGATAMTGWSYLIAQSPTQFGSDGTGSYSFSTGTNPLGLLGSNGSASGHLVLDLWQTTLTGSHGTPTAWVDEGYFTFSLSPTGPDDITYSTTPVPEPGTLALAGLGLAGLVAFRRRQ